MWSEFIKSERQKYEFLIDRYVSLQSDNFGVVFELHLFKLLYDNTCKELSSIILESKIATKKQKAIMTWKILRTPNLHC